MKAAAVAWEYLLPEEFERRLAARPIVWLPLGLCEPHGHIAPFGLDTGGAVDLDSLVKVLAASGVSGRSSL